MKVRSVLVAALLAGVALLMVPLPAAGRAPGAVPPGETEAERVARETVAAVRTSEQAMLTTSLAPLSRSQRQQLAVGPMAGRWTSCQLPVGFNPVHASVLPDGSVLLMAGSGNDASEFAAGRFQSYIFIPATCAATRLPTPATCSAAATRCCPTATSWSPGAPGSTTPSTGCGPATSTTG